MFSFFVRVSFYVCLFLRYFLFVKQVTNALLIISSSFFFLWFILSRTVRILMCKSCPLFIIIRVLSFIIRYTLHPQICIASKSVFLFFLYIDFISSSQCLPFCPCIVYWIVYNHAHTIKNAVYIQCAYSLYMYFMCICRIRKKKYVKESLSLVFRTLSWCWKCMES